MLAYTCTFNGYTGTTNLSTEFEGKLVWKVDWPMRWAFEHVDFEPAGDRPRDSRVVVHRRPRARGDDLGMPRPAWFGYAFVGFAGMQKMSSSAGGAPTAEDALQILEAPILRWLYVRRQPKQAFNIDFGARGRPAVRRVGRAGPQGRGPGAAGRAGARLRARLGHRDRRAACPRRRSSCRSGCCRRSPT